MSDQLLPPAPLLGLFKPSVCRTRAFTIVCTAGLRARSDALQAESDTLAAFRDTLLPQLISGELRLQDA